MHVTLTLTDLIHFRNVILDKNGFLKGLQSRCGGPLPIISLQKKIICELFLLNLTK